MIAGQSGLTQWALHPDEGSNNTASPVVTVASSAGEPVIGRRRAVPRLQPRHLAGEAGRTTRATRTRTSRCLNQTYASLPLSFMGKSIQKPRWPTTRTPHST